MCKFVNKIAFYEHEGIVPKAIIRAAAQELSGADSVTGGSTITQQLIKQQILTSEVTHSRKAVEMLYAMDIENTFSKDEILAGAFGHSKIIYAVALFAALLTAFYMFRLLALTFAGQFRGTAEQEAHIHESPSAMTIPLILLAVLSIIGGLVGIPEVLMANSNSLGEFLSPVFARSTQLLGEHHPSHQTELILISVTTVLSLVMCFWAWNKYKGQTVFQPAKNAFEKAIDNKFYVDELYNALFVRPYYALGDILHNIIDKKGIDGIVNGVGRGVNYGSRQVRLLQSGKVGSYLLLMVIGLLVLFIIQLFTK